MRHLGPDRRHIQAEAAAWLARLRADDVTQTDISAFQAWAAERPEHAQVFEAMNNDWESVGAAGRDLRGARRQTKTSHSRRKILSGLALVLAGGSAAAYWETAEADIYQTDVGEQRHVVLKNGCQVFLDTDTRLVVQKGSPCSAILERGCANFGVALDDNRPLTVTVGPQTVSTAHANMDVSREGEDISILVVEGEATVNDTLGYGVRRLDSGERFVRNGSRRPAIDRPATSPLLAWHNGQAIFNNERLADAIKRMNRYSAVKLFVADPATSDARISGVYAVGDNLAFANSVAKLLPVNVVYSQRGIAISADHAQ